jgi:LacI family asc operon transcriptional repressor
VPEEISLAGFDDSVIGKYYTPSLTTIHVPMDEMIRDAVEIVLHPDEKTVFSHQGTLVSRESVARRVNAE